MEDKKETICPTCGKESKETHLCVTVQTLDQTCDWCGALVVDEKHLCNDTEKEMAYKCSDCGRMAINADNLCSPKEIK